VIHLIASVLFYSRAIALKTTEISSSGNQSHLITDATLKSFSIYIFFMSIILYYWVVVKEKLLENRGGMKKVRTNQQNKLEHKFKRNKS